MPGIVSIGTALPEFCYSSDEVRRVGESWLQDCPEQRELFGRFLSASRTAKRTFALPPAELLELGGLKQRAELFERLGPPLGGAALRQALDAADITAAELRGHLFTSCSCPTIPAIDALFLEQVGADRTLPRLPIYQHGCAGGVVGLQLAADLAKVRGAVALTAVELCSLVFQRHNPTAALLVGAAIFADGAASVIISPEKEGLAICGYESYLVPDSRHLMGYDLLDDGFHLRLDRDLPRALVSVAPQRVDQFLRRYGLDRTEVDHWLFHPGGVKILDFLEETFALRDRQARWSREVLAGIGNISSATVLFVMKAFLDEEIAAPGDKVLMVGVGPGLTLELILFEWQGDSRSNSKLHGKGA